MKTYHDCLYVYNASQEDTLSVDVSTYVTLLTYDLSDADATRYLDASKIQKCMQCYMSHYGILVGC